MAEKLSITIALAGAEEIKRQLADVGQAGKDCFNDINQAASEVGGFNKLDVGAVTEQLVKAGVAGKDISKVLTAVNQAGRMETLVNGLKAVENGFANVQAAASAMDQVLLKGLTRSIGMVARLLPVAFGAATIGAIANTTNEIMRLDAAAIKLGVSVGDLGKAEKIFQAMGISAKEAAKGAAGFFEKLKADKLKKALEESQTLLTFPNLEILRQAAKEGNEDARKMLAEWGKLDTVLSPAAEAIERIKNSTMSLPAQLTAIVGVLEKMGNTAERDRLIFANFDRDFGVRLIQTLNAGTGGAARLTVEFQKLKTLLASGFEVSPEGLETIASVLAAITASLQTIAATDVFQGMSSILQNTVREIQTIINLLATLGQAGFNAMKYIELGAITAWQTIIGWIDKAIQKVKTFFSIGGGQASGAGESVGSFAGGGLMGGRGSGTSDSNLAWLSRGEHVMPARAVRQPGVLALLEALRRSGGNMRSVLDRMGHFAAGGIVGGGMSNVTIAFPGLPAIGGLRASGAVIDELRRAAVMAQVRSGGRKPSRYS